MRKRIVLATRNPHKTREFATMLGGEFSVVDLIGRDDVLEIAETGTTFEANAELKAMSASQVLRDDLVVADDSGLEVDALNGAPGVVSARYAGPDANDADNLVKLLQEMQGVPEERRGARFRCVLVVARNGEKLGAVEGAIDGQIIQSSRGEDGFGYDPIFAPTGRTQTFAEMSPIEKNRMSHRARAIMELRKFLATRTT